MTMWSTRRPTAYGFIVNSSDVRGLTGQFTKAPFDCLPAQSDRVDVVVAVFNDPPNVP